MDQPNEETGVVGHTPPDDRQKELANQVKGKVNELGELLDAIQEQEGENVDARCFATARTHFQTGSMWACRGIFKPTTFAG